MYPTKNPTEDTIRARREQFNTAIAERDVQTIRMLLAPNYHIVTGRSAQSHGANEEAGRWTEMFRSDPTTFYRRVTRDVTINEHWGWQRNWGTGRGTIPCLAGWSTPREYMPQNGSVLKTENG